MKFRTHPTIATIDIKTAKKSSTISSKWVKEVSVELNCSADNSAEFAEILQVSCDILIKFRKIN